MGMLRFNLHEGLASLQLGQAMRIAPALREVIEEYQAMGLTDREIVQIIASVINEIEAEKATKQ